MAKKQRNVVVSEWHHRKLKDMAYHSDRFKSEIVHEALGVYFGEFRPIDTAPKFENTILIYDNSCYYSSFVFIASWNCENKRWVCCGLDADEFEPVILELSEDDLARIRAGWLPMPGENA